MAGSMPADCKKANAFKASKHGTIAIAYDNSFAKSKFPFASTIATFRGRPSKPAVIVLYENIHKEFSDDANIV